LVAAILLTQNTHYWKKNPKTPQPTEIQKVSFSTQAAQVIWDVR